MKDQNYNSHNKNECNVHKCVMVLTKKKLYVIRSVFLTRSCRQLLFECACVCVCLGVWWNMMTFSFSLRFFFVLLFWFLEVHVSPCYFFLLFASEQKNKIPHDTHDFAWCSWLGHVWLLVYNNIYRGSLRCKFIFNYRFKMESRSPLALI